MLFWLARINEGVARTAQNFVSLGELRDIGCHCAICSYAK